MNLDTQPNIFYGQLWSPIFTQVPFTGGGIASIQLRLGLHHVISIRQMDTLIK